MRVALAHAIAEGSLFEQEKLPSFSLIDREKIWRICDRWRARLAHQKVPLLEVHSIRINQQDPAMFEFPTTTQDLEHYDDQWTVDFTHKTFRDFLLYPSEYFKDRDMQGLGLDKANLCLLKADIIRFKIKASKSGALNEARNLMNFDKNALLVHAAIHSLQKNNQDQISDLLDDYLCDLSSLHHLQDHHNSTEADVWMFVTRAAEYGCVQYVTDKIKSEPFHSSQELRKGLLATILCNLKNAPGLDGVYADYKGLIKALLQSGIDVNGHATSHLLAIDLSSGSLIGSTLSFWMLLLNKTYKTLQQYSASETRLIPGIIQELLIAFLEEDADPNQLTHFDLIINAGSSAGRDVTIARRCSPLNLTLTFGHVEPALMEVVNVLRMRHANDTVIYDAIEVEGLGVYDLNEAQSREIARHAGSRPITMIDVVQKPKARSHGPAIVTQKNSASSPKATYDMVTKPAPPKGESWNRDASELVGVIVRILREGNPQIAPISSGGVLYFPD